MENPQAAIYSHTKTIANNNIGYNYNPQNWLPMTVSYSHLSLIKTDRMATNLQPSINFTYRIHLSSSDTQLTTIMQPNDLQENDRYVHLGTGKLSDQNKHILVIQKDFSMKRKVSFMGNASPGTIKEVPQHINEHIWWNHIICFLPSQ